VPDDQRQATGRYSHSRRSEVDGIEPLGLLAVSSSSQRKRSAGGITDYRQLAFPKNRVLRIDHILLSTPLAVKCSACRIDRNARKGEKPSDHAPVIAELSI